MSEIRSLISLELRSFFDINKALYSKDKKAKARYRGLYVAWIILIIMAFFYVGGLTFGLCSLGLGGIVPAYLATIASMLVIVFGIFSAGNKIFSQKGYDILVSLPLKPSSIVIGRFLSLYIGDLFFTLIIMLPGIAVYGYCMQPPAWAYAVAIAGTLALPIIPLVISVIFGTFVLAISSRMKRKSLVQTVLMVAIVVGVLLSSFLTGNATENVTSEQLFDIAETVADAIRRLYMPAAWLNSAMVDGDIVALALFLVSSAAVMAAAIFILAKLFDSIVRRMQSFKAKHDYKIGAMTSRGVLKALYIREAKRYFSSSVYVTNTIIGPIMGMIMSIALAAVGIDTVAAALPLEIDIAGLVPFVISAVFCMMTTTSTSISMEGRQIIIVKALPISMKSLLDSKLLLNLSLMLPFYAVSVTALAIAVNAGALQLLWMLLIPASMMLFSVVLGITVNLKFHSFDWENEVVVVKQGLSAGLGGFAPVIICLLLGVAVMSVPTQYGDIAKAAVCVILLCVTAILYKSNIKKSVAAL